MSPPEAVLRLLGLAARAGAVVPGTARVRDAARAGVVRYVVVAGDASANSRSKLLPLLAAKRIGYKVSYDRAALGAAVGRGPLSAVGLTAGSFAAGVERLLAEGGESGMRSGPVRAGRRHAKRQSRQDS